MLYGDISLGLIYISEYCISFGLNIENVIVTTFLVYHTCETMWTDLCPSDVVHLDIQHHILTVSEEKFKNLKHVLVSSKYLYFMSVASGFSRS